MVRTVGLVFPVGVFAPRTGNPGFTVYISTLNFNTLIFSVWYHFTQVSYFIGSTCGAIGMFVVYSNHELEAVIFLLYLVPLYSTNLREVW